jgi:hypothetical protein
VTKNGLIAMGTRPAADHLRPRGRTCRQQLLFVILIVALILLLVGYV